MFNFLYFSITGGLLYCFLLARVDAMSKGSEFWMADLLLNAKFIVKC